MATALSATRCWKTHARAGGGGLFAVPQSEPIAVVEQVVARAPPAAPASAPCATTAAAVEEPAAAPAAEQPDVTLDTTAAALAVEPDVALGTAMCMPAAPPSAATVAEMVSAEAAAAEVDAAEPASCEADALKPSSVEVDAEEAPIARPPLASVPAPLGVLAASPPFSEEEVSPVFAAVGADDEFAAIASLALLPPLPSSRSSPAVVPSPQQPHSPTLPGGDSPHGSPRGSPHGSLRGSPAPPGVSIPLRRHVQLHPFALPPLGSWWAPSARAPSPLPQLPPPWSAPQHARAPAPSQGPPPRGGELPPQQDADT